jgi:hypothetical protein
MNMPQASDRRLPILDPELQISFFHLLKAFRDLYFSKALGETVSRLDIVWLDKDLARYVGKNRLAKVASFGLRGEVVFPVPYLLQAKPSLLGYYRLLYGLSQKEFYHKGPFGRFKVMEEAGQLPERIVGLLPDLCRSLVGTADKLVKGIAALSPDIVDDLQLLTLGPQLRGSQNTKLGQSATKAVADLIEEIVSRYIKERTDRLIRIENEAGRSVLIEFFSDPDIRIMELLRIRKRPLVSIEIKGGADASNVYNRLGEAEKSHQTAKQKGFHQFWTIVRVNVDEAVARRKSPTTTHLFYLDKIVIAASDERHHFAEQLCAELGIRMPE